MKVTQREKKKPKFRFSFIILFIIVSFTACFALYMREDFKITEDMFDSPSEAVVYIDRTGQETSCANPVPKGEMHDEDYYSDAVFIGGKALEGLSDYGYVSSDNMLLSDSIRLSDFNTLTLAEDGEESSIAGAVQRKGAKKIYIMVGLYDLQETDSSTLFDGLEAFIDEISAQNGDSKIYLMSLLPVPAEAESIVALNTDIDAFNSLLLKFADRKMVSYLDINTEFKGNDGKLPASAAEINGIRLKKEYYEKLSEYILTHVAE